VKRRKVGPVAVVVADDQLRGAQVSDRGMVTATVALKDGFKKSLRQLLSSAAFVGRDVVLGLEGSAVLIESLMLPPGGAKDARKACADRLKGDPLFNAEKAHLGMATETMPVSDGAMPSALAIMAAINKDRLAEVMKACHEIEVNVMAVEAAALATWRAWSGTGVQARLVCSGSQAALLAGQDDKLLFCRTIEVPIHAPELQATIARAASVLACEGFASITATGLDETVAGPLAGDLGLAFEAPPQAVADAAAAGLATVGTVLADFTPPEERVLREKRRVRKVSVVMAAVCAALVLGAGVLGTQKIRATEDKQANLKSRLEIVRADKHALEEVGADLQRDQANEQIIDHARPGHRMSTLFSLVSQSAGDGISIETAKVVDQPLADGKTAGAAAASSSGPRRRMLDVRLNGLARNGSAMRAFAEALLATGAFTDVRIEASERVLLGTGIEGERFRIYAQAETR